MKTNKEPMMVRPLFAALTLVFSLVALSSTTWAAEVQWIDDFEKAKATAKAEGKDILLNFTGLEWCPACKMLNNEVVSKKEFAEVTPKKFVMVQLDFPRDPSRLEPATRKAYEALQEKFNAFEFPVLLLIDKQGRPYARTGMFRGATAQGYNQHLADLQAKRILRDKLFADAEKAEGVKKAELLHQAMRPIDSSLLGAHYFEKMQEVVAADPDNKTGVADEYAAMITSERVSRQVGPVYKAINEFAGDNEKMLTLLDEALARPGMLFETRYDLKMNKIQLLAANKDIDAAVKVIDSMLADPKASEQMKLTLGVTKINIYRNNDEIKKALATADKFIAASKGQDAQLFNYHFLKAQTLADYDRDFAGALKAFTEAARYAREDSQEAAVVAQYQARLRAAIQPEQQDSPKK